MHRSCLRPFFRCQQNSGRKNLQHFSAPQMPYKNPEIYNLCYRMMQILKDYSTEP